MHEARSWTRFFFALAVIGAAGTAVLALVVGLLVGFGGDWAGTGPLMIAAALGFGLLLLALIGD